MPRNNQRQSRMAPPQIRSNVELRHRFRYVSTNSTQTGITPTSLLLAAGSVCTVANTTVTSFQGSVKVNRVEMWSPPSAQGSATTCSVEWVGYQNSPNREVSDTSVSVAQPAYVVSGPPASSLAAFWQVASATVLFYLVAPIGTIIDVHLSTILTDDDVASATVGVAAGTLGASYFMSLDPNATHRYTPVSLISTT
jgi:hypothetical protein